MTQADLETQVRDLLNEPNTQGRFSPDVLTRYINRAMDSIAIRLRWPEAQAPFTWNNLAENPLTEDMLAILRVYVGGQELAPTSIPLMEGTQLEMYDQSGKGQKPEWIALDRAPYTSPTTYPVTNTPTGYPVPIVPGAPIRPSYYLRGANLGIIPQPVNGAVGKIEFIGRPVQLTAANPNGVATYPDLFKIAIGYKAASYAKIADRKFDEANALLALFDAPPRPGAPEGEIQVLLRWKKQLNDQFVERPQPITYRTFYNTPITGSGGSRNWGWKT